MSTFHIQETSKNVQRMFKDFEKSTLPKYSVEELEKSIEDGALFFSQGALLEVFNELRKGEVSSDSDIVDQIKNLKPIAIEKSEGDLAVGYILKKVSDKQS
tara:strand:+ start:3588 stop:3890 length:303 start_codon:yes stop_codon:yes gene_type:complete